MVTDREILTEFIYARLHRAGDHLDQLKGDVSDVYSNSDRARIVTRREVGSSLRDVPSTPRGQCGGHLPW
jgi:hypothetical protein